MEREAIFQLLISPNSGTENWLAYVLYLLRYIYLSKLLENMYF